MIIREAAVNDAQTIKALHDRSALALCRGEYTAQELEAWVTSSSVEKYRKRLALHRAFTAEIDGAMVGFVRWRTNSTENLL